MIACESCGRDFKPKTKHGLNKIFVSGKCPYCRFNNSVPGGGETVAEEGDIEDVLSKLLMKFETAVHRGVTQTAILKALTDAKIGTGGQIYLIKKLYSIQQDHAVAIVTEYHDGYKKAKCAEKAIVADTPEEKVTTLDKPKPKVSVVTTDIKNDIDELSKDEDNEIHIEV